MIRIEGLKKQFAGTERPVVNDLDLEIAEGELCVLIGLSGCGKTTTLRMINRMIEADAGFIEVSGHDISRQDPVELRRHIGYVIQQVGLFPHQRIGDNIGTVPKLLGWKPARIQDRIDELLSLVGLEPAQYRNRFPRELSGGQRQRVGVARALAADPPVMLMDEPFGAIDPINRVNLQDEFLNILRKLKKTIVLVTHDIDEALKMGDRIAILNEGKVLQVATPDELLNAPVNDFVASFLGAGRPLKRLSLLCAEDVCISGPAIADSPVIAANSPARTALSMLLESGSKMLCVNDVSNTAIGYITMETLQARLARRESND